MTKIKDHASFDEAFPEVKIAMDKLHDAFDKIMTGEISTEEADAINKDMALFYDLATEKDFKIPTQPERRERALRDLIRKRQKPIALFIDDAHDLHSKTLIGLKRLIEVVRDSGTLSVVLAGHPKLKNDLRRPSMEEIGSRATIFEFEGRGREKSKYLKWLLLQSVAPKTKIESVITEDAVAMLGEKLSTPLQFEYYLTRALEEAYKVGQKPVEADMIENVLAKDINGLEPRLTRQGYNAKVLAELLNAKPREIKSFLSGQLASGRTRNCRVNCWRRESRFSPFSLMWSSPDVIGLFSINVVSFSRNVV